MVLTAAQLADLMPDATQLESDEPEMESSLHYVQLALLVACLEMLWQDRSDSFIGANLTIYFSRQQLKSHDFRGPDFFLVRNTQNKPRKTWVVWEEDGKYPDLIIELLSDSSTATDRALKKELYQTRFHTPEYFWFSPETLEFQGFRLVGQQYAEIQPNEQEWLWSEVLNLFLGVQDEQLRYFTLEGQLVPTPLEAVSQTQDQLSQAQNEVTQAQNQAARLAEQLRSLGIEPQI
jgi:Uma2 family endonuclease